MAVIMMVIALAIVMILAIRIVIVMVFVIMRMNVFLDVSPAMLRFGTVLAGMMAIVMMIIIVMMIVMVMVIMIVMMIVMVMVIMIVMMIVMFVMFVMVIMHRFHGTDETGLQRPLAELRFTAADHRAKHVGLIRQLARSGPVTDRFHNHLRQAGAELVHYGRDYARSSRRGQFHPMGGRSNGQAAHHLQRGRSRHRINPVVAAHRARTERYGRGDNPLNLQRIKGQGNADHVDDRIDGPHLVEMHLFHWNSVDFRLCRPDFPENRLAQGLNPFAKAGFGDMADNFRVMPMMGRRMRRIRQHVHLQGGDAAFLHPAPFDRERFNLEPGQFLFNVAAVRSGIDQSGERHIPADAGEAVQIQNAHSFTTFLSCFCSGEPHSNRLRSRCRC